MSKKQTRLIVKKWMKYAFGTKNAAHIVATTLWREMCLEVHADMHLIAFEFSKNSPSQISSYIHIYFILFINPTDMLPMINQQKVCKIYDHIFIASLSIWYFEVEQNMHYL